MSSQRKVHILVPSRWLIAGLAALSYALSDWYARSFVWVLLFSTAVCVVALHLMVSLAVRFAHLFESQDAPWLIQAEQRLRGIALLGASAAAMLIADAWLSRWMAPPAVKEIPVVRVLCHGGARHPDVPVRQGRACFESVATNPHGWYSSRDVWRVELERVALPMVIGDRATLTLEQADGAWLNLGDHVQVRSVR